MIGEVFHGGKFVYLLKSKVLWPGPFCGVRSGIDSQSHDRFFNMVEGDLNEVDWLLFGLAYDEILVNRGSYLMDTVDE